MKKRNLLGHSLYRRSLLAMLIGVLLYSAQAFAVLYTQPRITGFSPASGAVGTVVTITGSGLAQVNSATIGEVAAPVTSVSARQVTITVPAGASTDVIQVSNPARFARTVTNFVVNLVTGYPQPQISGYSPGSGPPGTVVTVNGSGYTGATTVWLGADHNLPFAVVSDSQLRFTVSATSTTAGFAILNPLHTAFSPTQFTVTSGAPPPPPPPPPPVPSISGFTPASGPVGTSVSVSGSGFTGATLASVGSSAPTALTVNSDTSARFTVPADAASGSVRIYNSQYSAASAVAFQLTAVVITPVVSGFAPAAAAVGATVVVNDSGFTGARTVQVGSSAPTPASVASDSQLSFTVPADATSGRLVVANSQASGASSATFTLLVAPPPPPPPPPPPSTIGQLGAARLLSQGTFGATLATIASTSTQSYDQWFAAQLAAPTTYTAANVPANGGNWLPLWWKNVIGGQDQLRQRVAFALSEILVTSDQSAAVQFSSQAIPAYHDILVRNALGNFRTLLEQATLSPTMGLYLNMMRSDKANPVTGSHADQNFAREVMQLFTIGLVKLNLDGSVQRDGYGNGLPTYSQADVEDLARVFTGFGSAPLGNTGENAWIYDTNILQPMAAYANHHDSGAKTIVGGVSIPAAGSPTADLKIALDTLFNHGNVGPFIGRQLIQRLVTSNPSPAYVQRVAGVFNNNGSGVRGDLYAVARAILTDPEAITPRVNDYGKLREPLLRLTHLWRAFNASDTSGGFNEYTIINQSSQMFAESPLSAPTVFNFFLPDYVRSGPTAAAGLVAPEFQITNENTLVLTNNQLQRQAYAFTDASGQTLFTPNGYSETPGSVRLKTAEWESYATTPATLIDQLNLVLMAGQMPAAMKTILSNYVAGIPTTDPSWRAYRAIEAADLIVNSSQYAVQH